MPQGVVRLLDSVRPRPWARVINVEAGAEPWIILIPLPAWVAEVSISSPVDRLSDVQDERPDAIGVVVGPYGEVPAAASLGATRQSVPGLAGALLTPVPVFPGASLVWGACPGDVIAIIVGPGDPVDYNIVIGVAPENRRAPRVLGVAPPIQGS